MNSSYGNYLHAVNLSRFHNNRCYGNVRNMVKRVQPMSIGHINNNPTKFKEALAKKEALSRLENKILGTWCGNTTSSTTASTNTSSSKVNSSTTAGNTEKTQADTNKLNLSNGKTFDVKLGPDKKVTFTCQNNQVYMSQNTGRLYTEDMKEVGKIEQLITSLVNDASGDYIKSNFSNNDVKDVLGKAGLKSGKFTINSNNSSNSFYMLDSGKIYSNYEVQAQRNFYNNTNFIKSFGYSDNAVCKIDGKNYKIGSDGTFNIPSGVLCVPENMIIQK